jgi:hypothetical protein
MEGKIITTSHTIEIKGKQIDLWYNFDQMTLQAFIDGVLILDSSFQPTRQSFNYVNVMDVSKTLLDNYEKRKAQTLKTIEKELLADQREEYNEEIT